MKNYLLNKGKKNIIITGVSGFIGGYLCRHLKGAYNVFGLDTKNKKEDRNVIIKVNLADKNKVKRWCRQFVKNNKIYAIVHLAARMASPEEQENMNIFYDNIKIAEDIIQMARILKPAKLINFSSMAVYPNKDGSYEETSAVKTSYNSDCLYGLSKFCVENMFDFMLRGDNIKITHLRIAQVYGCGMRSDRIIPTMCKELETKNRITVSGKGERISNFINVRKLPMLVDFFLKKNIEGIFNAGEANISFLQLAKNIIKHNGCSSSRIILRPTGSRVKFFLDTSKIDKILPNLSLAPGEIFHG